MHSSESGRRNLLALFHKFRSCESKISSRRFVEGRAMEERKNVNRIRKGHVAVYIGEECTRYEIPLKYLLLPKFQEFLRDSREDDYYLDFKIDGPIRLSCSTESFDEFLELAKKLH